MVEREAEQYPAAEIELRDLEMTAILLGMFDAVQETTHQSDRERFNQLVRFWADCWWVHPMHVEDH